MSCRASARPQVLDQGEDEEGRHDEGEREERALHQRLADEIRVLIAQDEVKLGTHQEQAPPVTRDGPARSGEHRPVETPQVEPSPLAAEEPHLVTKDGVLKLQGTDGEPRPSQPSARRMRRSKRRRIGES